MVIFKFSYLLPCITAPACQPETVGGGMAIRLGSARREIRHLKLKPQKKSFKGKKKSARRETIHFFCFFNAATSLGSSLL